MSASPTRRTTRSRLFDELGSAGRSLYALTEITLDFIFPPIYNGLLAILLFHVLEQPRGARQLLWLPVLTGRCRPARE